MSTWEVAVSPALPSLLTIPPPAHLTSQDPMHSLFGATQHFSAVLNCTRLLYIPLPESPTPSHTCVIPIYLPCFILASPAPGSLPQHSGHMLDFGVLAVLPELSDLFSPHSYHFGHDSCSLVGLHHWPEDSVRQGLCHLAHC